MVSKASDDFPEPDSPVNTTKRSRGMSRSIFLRLCSRAPRIAMMRRSSAPLRAEDAPSVLARWRVALAALSNRSFIQVSARRKFILTRSGRPPIGAPRSADARRHSAGTSRFRCLNEHSENGAPLPSRGLLLSRQNQVFGEPRQPGEGERYGFGPPYQLNR